MLAARLAKDEARECGSIAHRLLFVLGMRESSAPPAVRPLLVPSDRLVGTDGNASFSTGGEAAILSR
jgi:hypothetical protein